MKLEKILRWAGISKGQIIKAVAAEILDSLLGYIDTVDKRVALATWLNKQIDVPVIDEVQEQVLAQEALETIFVHLTNLRVAL